MKAIEFAEYGLPHEVCRCVEADPPGMPAADEVVVEIDACPINPADLLMIQDLYPGPDSLPARLGIEGVGRVVALGESVEDLAFGDRVMSLGRNNWAQRITLKAQAAIKLPSEVDPLQLAMLKANPASALIMLRDYVTLEPGDWVIQNAANSAVGHHLVRLAKRFGWRTVNVVRRPDVVERLVASGADITLIDGDDLPERVRAQTDGAPIKLAIDAIGGPATERLADCLTEDATLVSYGFLSGEPCHVTPTQLITRGLTVKGFWLVKHLSTMARADIAGMYQELAGLFGDGTLSVAVASTHSLDDIETALKAAEGSDRDGKVLLLPNGPVGE